MYLGDKSGKFYNKEDKLKINQWLLIFLRTIAILCLILIFSRPLIKGDSFFRTASINNGIAAA